MDSYIVRIYRRASRYSHKIAGLVELVDAQEQRAFTSYDELWNILNLAGPGKERRRRCCAIAAKRGTSPK